MLAVSKLISFFEKKTSKSNCIRIIAWILICTKKFLFLPLYAEVEEKRWTWNSDHISISVARWVDRSNTSSSFSPFPKPLHYLHSRRIILVLSAHRLGIKKNRLKNSTKIIFQVFATYIGSCTSMDCRTGLFMGWVSQNISRIVHVAVINQSNGGAASAFVTKCTSLTIYAWILLSSFPPPTLGLRIFKYFWNWKAPQDLPRTTNDIDCLLKVDKLPSDFWNGRNVDADVSPVYEPFSGNNSSVIVVTLCFNFRTLRKIENSIGR